MVDGILTSHCSATRGLLATDHVILNHGQVTWTTPELAPPILTTTPHQREDVSALDRFNVHRCPTRRVFSGTGLEPVTKQATVRYLYHSATAATPRHCGRLNVLKVQSDLDYQSQTVRNLPMRLSAICICPVELLYIPILLNETFTKTLWDTGAEKSFISEEVYKKYFFYKAMRKSRAEVVTAQGGTFV
ncbi:uncharacterized protein TNCV_587971 [Trichonephila clavipes]|nr:uncharacterized protein TNCV_587971 [Trichonephila clavipes]